APKARLLATISATFGPGISIRIALAPAKTPYRAGDIGRLEVVQRVSPQSRLKASLRAIDCQHSSGQIVANGWHRKRLEQREWNAQSYGALVRSVGAACAAAVSCRATRRNRNATRRSGRRPSRRSQSSLGGSPRDRSMNRNV